MSLLRRATWGVLVLLLALPGCRKREEGPEGAGAGRAAPGTIETEAVAADLPAGAAVVVSVYDLQSFWNRLKSTQLVTQLRAIPEIQGALDPQQNPRLAEALGQAQATLGMPLNEQTLFKLVGKKVQIGLYASPGDTADQRVVLVADMGDKDALTSVLNNLRTKAEAEGVTYRTEKYRDVDVTVVAANGDSVRGMYGFHKEKLVAASDQAGIQSAIEALDGEGQTMGADTLYKRALTHVGDANITVFINKAGTKGLVSAMARAGAAAGQPAEAAEAEAAMAVMDKYNVQSATIIGSNWTDEGLLITSYALLDPTAPGAAPLREMLQTPPTEVEVVGYYPDSTLGFYAVNFLDAPRIYDFVLAYVKDIARLQTPASSPAPGGDPAAMIDQQIAQFEATSGLNIRNDILGWMGKEASFGLNGVVKGGFFPVPEISLAIQTTDAARAKAFFDKLEARLVQQMQSSPQGFPLQFQQEEYKGVQIRYAPTPMGEGLAPGYVIHDDYALVALSRNSLKRMVDVKTGAAGPVTKNAQFAALSGFYPDEANFVGFVNTAQLVDEIGTAMGTFQQMRGQAGASQMQDTLTRVLAALKNLQAVGIYGVTDQAGFEQRFLLKIQ